MLKEQLQVPFTRQNSVPIHEKLFTRVYSLDMARAVAMLCMSLVHAFAEFVDTGDILKRAKTSPFYCIFYVILGPAALLSQFRGLFIMTAGAVVGYRCASSWLPRMRTKGKAAFSPILIEVIIVLCTSALVWPLASFMDTIRDYGENVKKYMRFDSTPTMFPTIPTNTDIRPRGQPIGAVVVISALLTPLLALGLGLASWASGKITQMQRKKRQTVLGLVANDHTFMAGFIWILVALVLSFLVAVLRYPVDKGVANSITRYVISKKMVSGVDLTDFVAVRSKIFAKSFGQNTTMMWEWWKNLDYLRQWDRSARDWSAHFYFLFMQQISGDLTGLFPFGISWLAGSVVGVLLVAAKNATNAPAKHRATACCGGIVLFGAGLLVVFGLWCAAYPDNINGRSTYLPWVFNGGYAIVELGLASKGASKKLWHEGPYELLLSGVQVCLFALVVYLAEFSKHARKLTREDDLACGSLVPYSSKTKTRAAGRWFRRYSSYSATIFCLDSFVYAFLYRVTRTWPNLFTDATGAHLCNESCTGAAVLWPILGFPIIYGLLIPLLDLFGGYLSFDWVLGAAQRLAGTLFAFVAVCAKQHSAREAWKTVAPRLKHIIDGGYRGHNGVQFVRFYDEDPALLNEIVAEQKNACII